jgi:hypothetical protein
LARSRRKVQRLLGETFFNDATVDYYARLGVPEIILLLRDGEEVAGHLALYRRSWRAAACHCALLGLDHV